MWTKIARYFKLETAPPFPMSLKVIMTDKEPLWNSIISKYGLAPHSYQEVSSCGFGDFVFSWDYDMIADGSKARRFGIHEYVETEEMFLNIFEDFHLRKKNSLRRISNLLAG